MPPTYPDTCHTRQTSPAATITIPSPPIFIFLPLQMKLPDKSLLNIPAILCNQIPWQCRRDALPAGYHLRHRNGIQPRNTEIGSTGRRI